MKYVLKGKWIVILAWVVLVTSLMLLAPSFVDLVREKGELTMPEQYSSGLANKILEEQGVSGEQIVLVFYDENTLSTADIAEAEDAVKILDTKKEQLGITEMLSHFHEQELKDQFVSEDGKTILVTLTVDSMNRQPIEITNDLYDVINHIKVDHFYTGSMIINEDVIVNSEEGLKKTEFITVGFILLVLIFVFRSLIAPFIPLVTVGLTYLASQSIVAFLIDGFNFPVSTFTQIFLVAILFGIGTDYCILLLSRFKEEISKHEDVSDAIVETYRTAGKTVIFSGIAVMIGFASIGFSTFKLYQSASAVAVGIAVLLVALFTVVPFFMSLLGEKLFWPVKKSIEHRESKLWDKAGQFTFKRPIIALVTVLVIVTPFLIFYENKLSFNNLDELGDDFNSVKAFQIISDSFGPGESLPTTIVIKNDEPMGDLESISIIEKISREVASVNGVASVRSITRPIGEPLEELFVQNQLAELNGGLAEGNDGIQLISEGLQEASTLMSQNTPKLSEATDGISDLINGTNELKSGVAGLAEGLKSIEQGMWDSSYGASQLKGGLMELQHNAQILANSQSELLNGYNEIANGLTSFSAGYEEIEVNLENLQLALANVSSQFSDITEKYPDLAEDPQFIAITSTINEVYGGLTELGTGLQQLNIEFINVVESVELANIGFDEAIKGQEALADGFAGFIDNIGQLASGISGLAAGQESIIVSLPGVSSGIEQIVVGQQELRDGFQDLGGQITQLTDGLDQSVTGLNEVYTGLETATDYLAELSAAPDEALTGWYLPNDVLEDNDFSRVFETYMSADQKTVTIDVIFNEHPYSEAALSQIEYIEEAIYRGINGSKLENATFGIGGETGINADLKKMSSEDFLRTVFIMIIGIFIMLTILLRSLIMPIYIILSLILTYFTSVAFAEILFVDILGYAGVSWAVPFFAFVMLVALGVDYSIFLMDRFNENKSLSVKEAMQYAMKNMGTVIISAALILGGTFAAMIPSGVLSLIQIATILLVGLLLYACVILPLFIPVMVNTFGTANWWPFKKDNSF
ncbi:MMPL family transporter [Cytobacillus sp. IB215316]|uniref:MMPL family transporter n=1 Tax=Cytobacillus sp. IB215316 TaxID=3097354 RepID=UPI002A15E8F6|nr:MMPL family transporter [Cytobacillus sp. IB215316]MDX8360056.1 MMPL family transporter [Cytobacillus sp. IB215316]